MQGKKTFKIYILLMTTIIFIVTFLTSVIVFDKNLNSQAVAILGEVDLTKWNFAEKSALISGQWELYENKEYYYTDFRSGNVSEKPFYEDTNNLSQLEFSKNRKATYKLRIKKDPLIERFAIKAPKTNSDYKMYANGVLLGEYKVNDENRLDKIYEFTNEYYDFVAKGKDFDLIILVDNQNTFFTNKFSAPIIGIPRNIETLKLSGISISITFVAILFCCMIILLGFYVSRIDKYRSLIFVVIGILFTISYLLIRTNGPLHFFRHIIGSEVFFSIKYILQFSTFLFLIEYFNNKENIITKYLMCFYRVIMIISSVIFIVNSDFLLYYTEIFVRYTGVTMLSYTIINAGIQMKKSEYKSATKFTGALIIGVSYLSEMLTDYRYTNPSFSTLGIVLVCIIIVTDIIFNYVVTNSELIKLTDNLENEILIRTNNLEIINVELMEEIEARKEAENKLKELSVTDHLTGLKNRTYVEQHMNNLLDVHNRYGNVFSVIMVDVDNFKRINDTFGHDVGDKVLVLLAETLAKNLRKTEIISRWGGEEFLIVLINSDLHSAIKAAEKLRHEIEKLEIKDVGGFTVSLGIGTIKAGIDIKDIIKQADVNLYRAKNNGKNCVVSELDTFL